jgi:hypothetical protein
MRQRLKARKGFCAVRGGGDALHIKNLEGTVITIPAG